MFTRHPAAAHFLCLLVCLLGARGYDLIVNVTSFRSSGGKCPGADCTLSAAFAEVEAMGTVNALIRIMPSAVEVVEAANLTVNGNLTIVGIDTVGSPPVIGSKGTSRFLISNGNLNLNLNNLIFYGFNVTGTGDMPGGAVIYSKAPGRADLRVTGGYFLVITLVTKGAYNAVGGAISWSCGLPCDIWMETGGFRDNHWTVGETTDTAFGGSIGLFSGGTLNLASTLWLRCSIQALSPHTTIAGSALGATGNIIVNDSYFHNVTGGVEGYLVFSDIGNLDIRRTTFKNIQYASDYRDGVTPAMIRGGRIRMWFSNSTGCADEHSLVTLSSSDQYYSFCGFETSDGSAPRLGGWQIFNRDYVGTTYPTNSSGLSGKRGLGFGDCTEGERWWPCPAKCVNHLNSKGVVVGYDCPPPH